MKFSLTLALCLLLIYTAYGIDEEEKTSIEYSQEEKARLRDAKQYFDMLESNKNKPFEEQIEIWQNFLANHPKHQFGAEIRNNIEKLDQVLSLTDPSRKKEETDTLIYQKAIGFADRKNLSTSDRILLWNQFMQDNPTSIYLPEVEVRLRKLRSEKALQTPPKKKDRNKQPLSNIQKSETIESPTRIASPQKKPEYIIPEKRPYKDDQKALLLGSLVGLVAPGAGHWYTEDYQVAATLTGAAAIGAGVMGVGLYQYNSQAILTGALIYGLSYFIGVSDAPFSAKRYNRKLDKRYEESSLSPKIQQLLALQDSGI
ncbi:MAG: hypothetical protein KDD52_03490 [Bdellovibrionales bacterium]|nr:hypothetical protein [Bdellovibrionales bacterium]